MLSVLQPKISAMPQRIFAVAIHKPLSKATSPVTVNGNACHQCTCPCRNDASSACPLLQRVQHYCDYSIIGVSSCGTRKPLNLYQLAAGNHQGR